MLCPLQTETPEQLKVRNAARKPGQKMINVVDRQAVAVLSRGTLMDPEMVSAHPDAAYVLSGRLLIGVTALSPNACGVNWGCRILQQYCSGSAFPNQHHTALNWPESTCPVYTHMNCIALPDTSTLSCSACL